MSDDSRLVVLANVLSEVAGRLSAMDAAIRALIAHSSANPALHDLVCEELEKEYADHLATSQNAIFLEEFEAQADSLRAKLSPPKVG